MNIRLFLLAVVLILQHHSAHSAVRMDRDPGVPHLELDMESAEYAPYLRKIPNKQADEPSIAEALRLGQRLSAWIQAENAKRPADRQLRLTSAATRTGVPIDTPSQYNPAIIQTRLDTAMAAMPQAMREVLNTRLPYPDTLPVADADFVTFGRQLDRVYQSAARWKTLKPYLSYYIRYQARDVRGYYFLKKNGWTEERLNSLGTLDPATQTQVRGWLVTLCQNSGSSESYCRSSLEQAVARNEAGKYFTQYLADGETNWREFFDIPSDGARRDIVWSASDATVARIPFNRPTNARIESYLRDNIEDEWKWNNWNLRLNFGSFPNGPRVEFQTGVVPHVDGIGGNQIVMDENQPVEEYESQWTIRHEFGHVLGFPDCYHEFYDSATESFINYQLDVTDLMCSRAGNMNERLFNELRRVYFQ
jgi:hypothetical protein